MTKITWGNPGYRLFEVGIDRGVLFVEGRPGVAWEGLSAVAEATNKAAPQSYYIDGQKYLSVASAREFAGTIAAYTYPDEFNEVEGSAVLYDGLIMDEQVGKSFGLSYRTLVGNDEEGTAYGYKLHFVYNALAIAADRAYASISDRANIGPLTWGFSTTPLRAPGDRSPYSHLIVDSTKRHKALMRAIEKIVYGTDKTPARLPALHELEAIFKNPPRDTLKILPRLRTGLNRFDEVEDGDLVGRLEEGLYTVMSDRLRQIGTPGLSAMKPFSSNKGRLHFVPSTGLNNYTEDPSGYLDLIGVGPGLAIIGPNDILFESEMPGLRSTRRLEYQALTITPAGLPHVYRLISGPGGDVVAAPNQDGAYNLATTTRLTSSDEPGVYTLE